MKEDYPEVILIHPTLKYCIVNTTKITSIAIATYLGHLNKVLIFKFLFPSVFSPI